MGGGCRKMKERPIPFSGEMVRAILEGRKTQTRRVVKPQPAGAAMMRFLSGKEAEVVWRDYGGQAWRCPYGVPGDRLWVREGFGVCIGQDVQHAAGIPRKENCGGIVYRAGPSLRCRCGRLNCTDYWRPSIHMPRWASRITLEVVGVRVERVQDITDDDAVAEGIDAEENKYDGHKIPRVNFSGLWDSINEKRGYGWEVNPWVWIVEFKRDAAILAEANENKERA